MRGNIVKSIKVDSSMKRILQALKDSKDDGRLFQVVILIMMAILIILLVILI